MEEFLRSIVATDPASIIIAAGIIAGMVYGIIEGADAWVKKYNAAGMAGNLKFTIALVLSFGIPYAAYLALQAQTQQRIELYGLMLAGGVGYAVSQIVHRMLEGQPEKEAPGGIT